MRFEWEAGSNRVVFEEPLYFEDFIQDMRFNFLPWAVISSPSMIYFGIATGDRNALHTDEAFAGTSALGGTAAHGGLIINSLFGALHAVNFWNKSLEALLEKHVEFTAPARPEDKVKHFLYVAGARKSQSRRDAGIVKFGFYTLNQRYENVAKGWFKVLVRKKGNSKEA